LGDIELKLALLLVVCKFLSQRIRPNYLLYQETWCISHAETGGKAWIPGLICDTSGFQWVSGGERVFHGGSSRAMEYLLRDLAKPAY